MKEISEILSLKNGYGFMKYPNNNLFFHYQNVIGDFTELQVGDTVEFVLDKNSEKQDIAKNVRKIDPDILLKSPILEDDFFDWNNE